MDSLERVINMLKKILLFALLSFFVAGQHTAVAANKEIKWVGCGISKLGFMKDLAKAYEKKTGVKIKIEGGGATKGLRQVASGKSELGGSCRLPLVSREKRSARVIDKESTIKLIPVGWDALVVIVHKDNKLIDSISRQNLRDLLTGKITNWKQLGAKSSKKINLYIRKGKISGVGRTLRQQLFNNTDEDFAKTAIVKKSSGKIEKAILKDKAGIGVSGISSSRHRNLRMLQLDGLEPTMANLKSAKYSLYRILFLVAPANYKERPELKEFVNFALSPAGSKIIRKAGTLPYLQGISLVYKASADYIDEIEVVDRQGIYTLGGN